MIAGDDRLTNRMNTITCRHCGEKVLQPQLAGLTLVCPHCEKTVNGQYFVENAEMNKEKNGV